MPDFDNFLGSIQNNNRIKMKQDNVVRCANCGAPNSPTAIVCADCGNAVSRQLTGFTVNKNAFVGQPYRPVQTFTAQPRPVQPPVPRPPQNMQPARPPAGQKPYEYYPYYNGNANSYRNRSVPMPHGPAQRPYAPPPQSMNPQTPPPYYGGRAPVSQPPYASPPAYAPPAYRPPYAAPPLTNGHGQTPPRPPYEGTVPENKPLTAPPWPTAYDGGRRPEPAAPAERKPDSQPDPEPMAQLRPSAPEPIEFPEAETTEQTTQGQYAQDDASRHEAKGYDNEDAADVGDEPVEEMFTERPREPKTDRRDTSEDSDEQEFRSLRFEVPEEGESTVSTEKNGIYADRISQYKEQLRKKFDNGDESDGGKKKSNPYRDDLGLTDREQEEKTTSASARDTELTWKNIPAKGASPRATKIPIPSAPSFSQRPTGAKGAEEIHPSLSGSTTVRSHGDSTPSAQSLKGSRTYYHEPEPDLSYDVTILDKEYERPTPQLDSTEYSASQVQKTEQERPQKAVRSAPEQSPFPEMNTGGDSMDTARMSQMWAAYQQQMMGGAYPPVMGGQPVMVPSQMQPYAQMQGFPGMPGGMQPVALQSGMMPAGVPVPMYVVMNPNGGMTMYYMSPNMMPPMLPQAGNTSDSPTFETVISTPVSSETQEKIRNHERYDGRYLAYMDFSEDKYLRWEHIRFADNIVGVKYPTEFDIESADFAGKDISFSDFSNVPYLKWKQLKRATSLKGIIYAREFNIDRADFSGRDISQSDFSALRFLRWKHIQPAGKIKGIVYPPSFDIERADFSGRDISFSDFTRLEDLRWKHIRAAGSIRGIEYPPDFNIDRAEFFDRDISFSDFTRVDGFRWQHIVNTYRIYGLAYPASFDIENADFSSRNIAYSDFSKVMQLNFTHIRMAQKINGIVYPGTFNMQRSDFRGRDISYSDFSMVKNMRFEHIAAAADIKGIIYPQSFDLENADFRGFDMRDSDFSLLPVYKKAYLEQVTGENMIPPATGAVIR